eukprot:GILK01009518.1.p1 GENE.GILK01009518.1~~GILK01009518.1.p1  ORF type:complete len:609 (-),score=122.47 GILK01009518.1:277-2103(-)
MNLSFQEKEYIPLDELRESLIRQEESIIFLLLERSQFSLDAICYRPGGLPMKNGFSGSFAQWVLYEMEKVHASARRYASPDEHPFAPAEILPEAIIPPLHYPPLLVPNSINHNQHVWTAYTEHILPAICIDADDQNYGSAATIDMVVLQALSRRIHYGKFVAEAKYRAQPDKYDELVVKDDQQGLWEAITDDGVENRLLERIHLKARTYGQELIEQNFRATINPEIFVRLFRDYIIPLTKRVQIEYLLQRKNNLPKTPLRMKKQIPQDLNTSDLPPYRIALLGPAGTFSHEAVQRLSMAKRLSPVFCESFNEILETAGNGCADLIALPWQNSTTGVVVPAMEAMTRFLSRRHAESLQFNLELIDELYLPVSHCLATRASSLNQLKRIYSHPQALKQCSQWLSLHLPADVQRIEVKSTAAGADLAASDPESAAICSDSAAESTHIPILSHDIQDHKKNATRFLIFGNFEISHDLNQVLNREIEQGLEEEGNRETEEQVGRDKYKCLIWIQSIKGLDELYSLKYNNKNEQNQFIGDLVFELIQAIMDPITNQFSYFVELTFESTHVQVDENGTTNQKSNTYRKEAESSVKSAVHGVLTASAVPYVILGFL